MKRLSIFIVWNSKFQMHSSKLYSLIFIIYNLFIYLFLFDILIFPFEKQLLSANLQLLSCFFAFNWSQISGVWRRHRLMKINYLVYNYSFLDGFYFPINRLVAINTDQMVNVNEHNVRGRFSITNFHLSSFSFDYFHSGEE